MSNWKASTKKFLKWLFLKDLSVLLITGLLVFGIQWMMPLFVDEALISPIGMGYIYKSFASVAVAGILIWGSWFLFRMIWGFASEYFDQKFKTDINAIMQTDRPWEIKWQHYLRPLFFLLLYFAFLAVVISTASAKLF